MEVGTQHTQCIDGRVVKHFSRDLELEASKHRALFEIGQRHGFRVPILVEQDTQGGILKYEFIPGLTSCRQHFLDYAIRRSASQRDAEQESLFQKYGHWLAIVHRELKIEPRVDWRVPPEFEKTVEAFTGGKAADLLDQTPQALLHGDFGFSNVCFTPQEPHQLIMIDPSPNRYSSFSCNEQGSIYLDISKFTLCLRGLVPKRYNLQLRRARLQKLRERFVHGYSSAAGLSLDAKVLAVVERAQLTCKIRYEMRRALARTAAAIMLFGLNDGRVIGKIANAK